MKKIILALSLIFLFSLSACKKNNSATPKEEKDTKPPVTETSSSKPSEDPSTVNLSFDQLKFDTMSLKGERIKSENFLKDTKLTMVNVWGTFCPPCIKELPDLAKLNKEYDEKDFRILGIVIDTVATSSTNVEAAEKLIHDAGVTYTNIMPNPSMDSIMQNFQGVPTTFFVDKEGKVVGKAYAGAKSYDEWKSIITQNLKTLSEKK